MSPGHKPQNSAISGEGHNALGDMGDNIRVRRVTWHPAQAPDNAPLSGAAPVRTVHYIPLRHNTRTSLRVRPAEGREGGQRWGHPSQVTR